MGLHSSDSRREPGPLLTLEKERVFWPVIDFVGAAGRPSIQVVDVNDKVRIEPAPSISAGVVEVSVSLNS